MSMTAWFLWSYGIIVLVFLWFMVKEKRGRVLTEVEAIDRELERLHDMLKTIELTSSAYTEVFRQIAALQNKLTAMKGS